MSFDWQTEESGEWEEVSPVEAPPEAASRRRWPWFVVLVLVVAGGVGLVAYRELFRRMDVGTSNAEADLLASYDVVQTAVSNQDSDLLANFLSGVDAEWVRTIDQLVANGRFYDRTPFYLTWQPPQTVLTPTITISPDLTEAELVTEQQYVIHIGNGVTETIRLQETAVYRRGANRWLLAPPKPEFWGEAQTFTGEVLVLRYLARDAEIAQRLALDIDAKLLEFCAKFPEFNCSDEFEVRLTLTSNLEWLNTSQSISVFWLPQVEPDQLRLTPMPTPSLIGLPVDEAGYEALYRGYASVILSAVVDNLLTAECCFDAVLYQAAFSDMLAQLSLQPWPLSASDYQQFLLKPEGWSDLQAVWDEKRPFPTPDEDWAAFALVDYVVHELRLMTAVEFQQSLIAFAERPYTDWIQHVFARLQSNALPEQAWLHFLYEKSELAQTAPPIPLPAQSLVQVCQDSQSSWSLVQYDWAANEFSYLSREVKGPAFLHGLPDDAGVVVGEQITSDGTSSLFLWVNGQKTEVAWPRTSNTPGAVPLLLDPTGQRLLLSGPPNAVAPFGVFPVAACLAGESCNLETVIGFPIWSPDGTQTLVAAGYAYLDDVHLKSVLYLGNGDGVITDADVSASEMSGSSPFWVDNGRFGYVGFDSTVGETAVYLQNVGAETPRLLLIAAELAQAIPDNEEAVSLKIESVIPHAQNADQLLIGTSNILTTEGAAHLFLYDMVEETLSHIFAFMDEPTTVRRGHQWSQNGRFLAITSFAESSAQWQLYVHDFQTGATRIQSMDNQYSLPAHHSLDWSANINWLTIVQDGMVRIIHPQTGYERWAVSPVLSCSSAAWVTD